MSEFKKTRVYKKYDFMGYEEIPSSLASYMLTVAEADNIAEIPLQDINDFLNGLGSYGS